MRHAFETSHIFGTVNARILKFHICIAYETLADQYLFFLFCQIIRGGVRPLFRLRRFRNEHFASKGSNESIGLNNSLLNIICTTQTYKNDIKDQITS